MVVGLQSDKAVDLEGAQNICWIILYKPEEGVVVVLLHMQNPGGGVVVVQWKTEKEKSRTCAGLQFCVEDEKKPCIRSSYCESLVGEKRCSSNQIMYYYMHYKTELKLKCVRSCNIKIVHPEKSQKERDMEIYRRQSVEDIFRERMREVGKCEMLCIEYTFFFL